MSVVPAALRIKPGVKSIISSQASFIIIYAACVPGHVRSQNEKIRFPKNRKLFRSLLQSRNSVSRQPQQQMMRGFILILSSQSGWTESNLISQTGQPGKRFLIRFLRCRDYVGRYFRCVKDLPDHRLILRVFLSSSFPDIEIFTLFFTKKMRITYFMW